MITVILTVVTHRNCFDIATQASQRSDASCVAFGLQVLIAFVFSINILKIC
jgi:hypothetical protein